MGENVSVLTLAPVSLARMQLGTGGHLSARNFFDFVVNGEPLRPTLDAEDVAVLSTDWNSGDFARQLLLEAPWDPRLEGRTQVYGCRECLDLECGGIAVNLARVGERIRWENFARFWPNREYDRFEFETVRSARYDFDLSQYRSVFEPFLR